MLDQLLVNYLLFFIKLLTICVFPLILIHFVINLKKDSINITLRSLNKEYLFMQKIIYEKIYFKKKGRAKINKLFSKYKSESSNKNNIFIINFDNDISAKHIFKIRLVISTIILVALKDDEVLLKLNSAGGFVNNYGLAACEFERIRKAKIKIIVAIDLIAASGGFLIASVANEIIASKFAIIGSIGVLGIVPNFNKFLEKKNIDIEYHTSGNYKTTLGLFSKNTSNGRNKFIESLSETHLLFKKFIKKYRNAVDIEKVATGECWYGEQALSLKLIDKIQTSEEFILKKINISNIYEIDIVGETFVNRINNSIKRIMS